LRGFTAADRRNFDLTSEGELVDIGAVVDSAGVFCLFGGHVVGGSHACAGLGHAVIVFGVFGEAEVGDFYFAFTGQHDVIGLDIPVDATCRLSFVWMAS